MPRSVAMRARSTSSPEAISASSKACRLAICSASQVPLALDAAPRRCARSCAIRARLDLLVRDDLGAALARASALRHLDRLLGERDLALELGDLERFLALDLELALRALRARCAPSPAPARARSARARSPRGSSSRVSSSDAAAGDLAALRVLLVLDARLGDVALLRRAASSRSPRATTICACSASWSRSARSRRVRRAARRGGSRPRAPARGAHIRSRGRSRAPCRWVSRFWLRISTSVRCSISLRILRRVSIDLGELRQALGVEGVGRIEIFEAGLVEVDDAPRSRARAR